MNESSINNEQDYIKYIISQLRNNRVIKESDILSDIEKYELNEQKVVNLLIDANVLPPISEENKISDNEFISNLYQHTKD